mmetsp:Transcript_32623/g.114753  ORF Transcript_32623/g.114753 Transcript_32623/m.114753 type:complete len:208 (-) Transcript_32623:980-1603(-)
MWPRSILRRDPGCSSAPPATAQAPIRNETGAAPWLVSDGAETATLAKLHGRSGGRLAGPTGTAQSPCLLQRLASKRGLGDGVPGIAGLFWRASSRRDGGNGTLPRGRRNGGLVAGNLSQGTCRGDRAIFHPVAVSPGRGDRATATLSKGPCHGGHAIGTLPRGPLHGSEPCDRARATGFLSQGPGQMDLATVVKVKIIQTPCWGNHI